MDNFFCNEDQLNLAVQAHAARMNELAKFGTMTLAVEAILIDVAALVPPGGWTPTLTTRPTPKTIIPQKATNTLNIIRQTNAAPKGYKGGRVFANDGRGGGQVLPKCDPTGQSITYREFDVNPFQKGGNRGAERIVIGSDGKAYFTNDHYGTFIEIP